MNRITTIQFLSITVVLATLVGCHQPNRDIFPPPTTSLVWPAPPAPPRIRYVGQLASSANLKSTPKPFQGLTDLLFGAQRPQALFGPRDVVTSEDGRHVWIADPGGRCLHGFDLVGRTYVKVTHAGPSPLVAPVGVSRGEAGSIWVCDSAGVAIHRFAVDNGTWQQSLRLPEDIHRPVASYWHDAQRELYVVDTIDHNLKVLDETGRIVRIIGTRGNAPGTFNFPSDIASDGRTLWIADTGNQRIQSLSLDGDPITTFGRVGTGLGDLAMPKSVALDSKGHLYVVDARFENIQVFAPDGTLLLFFGEEGVAAGEFWLPGGIFVDNDDRIWVSDTYNKRIQVFDFVQSPSASGLPDQDRMVNPGKAQPRTQNHGELK